MDDLIVNGKQNFMGKEITVVLGGFGREKGCTWAMLNSRLRKPNTYIFYQSEVIVS